MARGLQCVVLSPGSRSAPLAIAAGGLAECNQLKLITSIDERSAAFMALGMSAAKSKAIVVITTSGSAVANLLPAAIEADRSCCPLILITADRPSRLKNCGANQTVNQEDFLKSVCRSFENGPAEGVHKLSPLLLDELAHRLWTKAHESPGPVHLNLPIEEPLYPSKSDQKEIWEQWKTIKLNSINMPPRNRRTLVIDALDKLSFLNFDHEGVVVIGPWRGGDENELIEFNNSLKALHLMSGWPIFADPLSGVSADQPGLVNNWELLIESKLIPKTNDLQVLRLGSLPASKSLEDWLIKKVKKQLLIIEGDKRPLDPIRLSVQVSKGFVAWFDKFCEAYNLSKEKLATAQSKELFLKLHLLDSALDDFLDDKLPLFGSICEPGLARWIPRLVPSGIPVMLSASSPVRDWITYSCSEALNRRCFGFRGASGIDGTLSLGMGLAIALGRLVLVSGDLAFLHDTNGLLFSYPQRPKLLIILIDNGGGGIFQKIGLQGVLKGDFEDLFKMPQNVDHLELASSYGIPYRQVASFDDLRPAIEWGLSEEGPALLRVCTDSTSDTLLRKNIRDCCEEYLQSLF